MTYDQLKQALYLFGFHESDLLTIRRIKDRQRTMLKKHHPDVSANPDQEQIRKINAAARLIMDYVQSYQFSFSEAEFYRQNPEEQLRRQFAWDAIWSGKLEEK
jgi:hypothetical protein